METATHIPLFLDDLDVGRTFTSASLKVAEEDIVAFARQFDPQPFHLDHEAARRSLFGGLAASGWHTTAITMKLLVGDGAPFAGGMIGAGVEIRWPTPTRPRDVLRVESEVLDINPSQSKPDRGIVTLRSQTLNQQDEVRQVLVSRLVVPRRPLN